MAGGNAAALQADAAALRAASAPVLSAIARARPLITADTLSSPSANAWSGEWQSLAQKVVSYLAYTLPGDVQTAITAAQKAEQAAQPKTPAGVGPRPS